MHRIQILLLLTLVVAPMSSPAEWQPAAGRIRTRWAAEVDPAKALPAYPRPQMVRPQWANLNGLWDYAITEAGAAQPDAFEGSILVPFCIESALSGVGRKLEPAQALWYRRILEVKPPADGQRILLHFGGVEWNAAVWLNGKKAGRHQGGYDPFTLDITDHLEASGKQELVLKVLDPTDQGLQPIGKQRLSPKGIMYTAVSGIWQTVWMETVPARHIRSLHLVPDYDRGAVSVEVVSSDGVGDVQVEVLVDEQAVARATGPAGQALSVELPGARAWSPSDPYLYQLRIQLGNDEVRSYTGLRKIEMKKDEQGVNRLFLNGEALYQHGPLDQGWWPDGLYTAPTDDALRYDIETTRAMGFNMTRKHVKIEPDRWYYWCDVKGLMVWQDMPSTFTKTPDALANLRREMKTMVDSFRNHPCIVMWVPYNEGWGQQDTEAVTAWFKAYDPSRLVNNASGWTDTGVGDVRDHHAYPGPGMPPLEENRAAVLGEYGGLGLVVDGHLWQNDKNWGYRSFPDPKELEQRYAALTASLRGLIGQGLAASVYTQITDVETEVNGLLTYDRQVSKIPVDRLAGLHAPLYLPPPVVRVLVPCADQGIKVSWRYTTENPGPDWMKPEFDDSGWKEGMGGFGTQGTPGAKVGTEWKGDTLWIRRVFPLAELPTGSVKFNLYHDEDAEVYLNGASAAELKGFTTSYTSVPFDRSLLKTGENCLAIHCMQTQGGQFVDAGIIIVEDEPAP